MGRKGWESYSVDVLMTRWPQTISVFLDNKMLCTGCPIGSFHDLADAAAAHGISLEDLKLAIAEAIKESSETP